MTTNPPASHKPARWRPTAAVLAATTAALSLAPIPAACPGWSTAAEGREAAG